jgi:hypothetical protein
LEWLLSIANWQGKNALSRMETETIFYPNDWRQEKDGGYGNKMTTLSTNFEKAIGGDMKGA